MRVVAARGEAVGLWGRFHETWRALFMRPAKRRLLLGVKREDPDSRTNSGEGVSGTSKFPLGHAENFRDVQIIVLLHLFCGAFLMSIHFMFCHPVVGWGRILIPFLSDDSQTMNLFRFRTKLRDGRTACFFDTIEDCNAWRSTTTRSRTCQSSRPAA